jgi:hypothetical protein
MDTTTVRTTRTATAATPLGAAAVVAELRLPASLREGDEIVLQRLDSAAGPLVRLGYRRADRMIRGPVSLTRADVETLRALVAATPDFAALIGGPEK